VFEILPQLIVNGLISGSIYALASSGLALTYGLLRVLNFAQGHLMMLGAYIFYLFAIQWELPLFYSAMSFAASIGALGAVVFVIFVQPFAKIDPLLTFVATMALATVLESVVSLTFGVNVRSLSTGGTISSLEFAGVYITPVQILIMASALILLSVIAFVVHSTALGRRIRALAEHSHAAEAIGVSRLRVTFGVFLLGTLVSAFAGVLVGYETNLQPTMGASYTIKAFAAMILGGLGNLWGAIVGSFVLGIVENLAIGIQIGGVSIPAGYKDAFAFSIILLMLLFRPQGLFGSPTRRT
jgi:branched-subunit amino acid ABC-type transport system permease component